MRSQLRLAPALAVSLALVGTLAAGCLRGGGSGPGNGDGNGDGDGESGPRPGPGSGSALYVRLGGVDGIRAVVDEMVGRIAADQRIQRFFVETDFRRFKSQLVVQVCELSGGPCRYRGRPMRGAHRGRRIRSAHFEAMLEDARDALKAAQVGERERHELLSILRGLKQEIVEPAR
ncbi:MAG TPA: group 1 truncated hemoglobin [Kofleriaceae bacterium]|nr:group 1 truncated hemoglobin [Kofleriaceae bacterium]